MKKRLFLHIGRHKTGTSFIQQWLLHNRSELAQKGFYYPQSGLSPTSGQAGLPWSIRFRGDHATVFSELRDELLDVDANNVIISSEAFLEPGVWEDLLFDYLNDLPYDIKVICYVRRQDEFFESAYNQAVKGGGRVCEPNKYTCRLDNEEVLDGWEKQFGAECLSVGVYAKSLFYKGELIQDFCHRVGLDARDFKGLPGIANKSLSRRSIEFIRVINRIQLPAAERESLVQSYVQSESLHFEDPCRFFLRPEDRQLLVNEYKISNLRFAEKYRLGEEQVRFLIGDVDRRDWSPMLPLSSEEIAMTVYELLRGSESTTES